MRTTVTVDPDLASRLKELAQQRGTSFKAVLNEVIRRGLSAQEQAARMPPFEVEPHAGGFRPGIDAGKLNQLLDELEVVDFAREADSRRCRSGAPRCRDSGAALLVALDVLCPLPLAAVSAEDLAHGLRTPAVLDDAEREALRGRIGGDPDLSTPVCRCGPEMTFVAWVGAAGWGAGEAFVCAACGEQARLFWRTG